MSPPPAEVVQWLKRTYPRPSVDPEWLEGCYSWIEDELNLNPARDMPTILEHVNTQLLESDFADSMIAGTGIPQDALGAVHTVIKGPILVEVVGIMDVGHGAGTLLQVYESRVEYKKQAELRSANGDEAQQKPMPKFPRSMLHLKLSDGVSVLPAVEAKSLPQLELGETPLGFKMIIKNVTVRRGTALLEPKCVELKGHRTADRDEQRDAIFLRALKQRLGEDVPEEEPPAAEAQAQPAVAPAPAPARAESPRAPATPPRLPQMQMRAKSPVRSPRQPLAGIAIPLDPRAGPSNAIALNANEHADDTGEPRRRKLPTRANRTPSPDPPPRDKDKDKDKDKDGQRSRFFIAPRAPSASSSSPDTSTGKVTLRGPGTDAAMAEFARSIGLSPRRGPPIDVPDDDEDSAGDDEVHTRGRAAPATSSSSASGSNLGSRSGPPRVDVKQKSKQRSEPDFAVPSSDPFDAEFVMDAKFLEEVARAEEEALKRDSAAKTKTGAQAPSSETKVKAEALSQATTSATLYGSGTVASTSASTLVSNSRDRHPSVSGAGARSGSRAPSVPGGAGPSSGVPKARAAAAEAEVIMISDDEEGNGKENIPIPTRHVRRRVARWAGEDVIELSD